MITIVLLAASVSVGRAFVNLVRIDRGFDLSEELDTFAEVTTKIIRKGAIPVGLQISDP